MNTTATYPEFDHEAHAINKYIEASGLFSILLRNGNIEHFRPASAEDFRNWLCSNGIENISVKENRRAN